MHDGCCTTERGRRLATPIRYRQSCLANARCLPSRFDLLLPFHSLEQCRNGVVVVKNARAVKRLSTQLNNSWPAAQHGTRVASSAKHVRQPRDALAITCFIVLCRSAGNSTLTLASYKDFSQDVYCKSKIFRSLSRGIVGLWIFCRLLPGQTSP